MKDQSLDSIYLPHKITFGLVPLLTGLAMGWLVSISLNLLLAGAYDVAVRDLALAVGAYSLGTVAGLKGLEWVPALSRSSARLRRPAMSATVLKRGRLS